MKLFAVMFIFILSSEGKSKENTIEFSAPADESTLLLPVPNMQISSNSVLKITQQGKVLNASFSLLNTWNTATPQKFIRLLSIKLSDISRIENEEIVNYNLNWTTASKASTNLKLTTLAHKIQPYLVYPEQSWLAESILLHPKINNLNTNWYTQPQSLYGNFLIDEVLLEKHGYPKSHQSQWLFDRARAIFQLFILTNDDMWLKEGIKISHFYMDNLDDSGRLLLSQNFDLKFLMPNGLLYYYFLTGDNKIKSFLQKLFELSLVWQPVYTSEYKFWTERHQAAALNIAIAYWEISASNKAKTRINEIINATVQMVFYPKKGWDLKGCPQHTYKSHEGKSGISPVCSPWMMALLGDSLWRYYRLTHDKKSAALLNAFGDFMPNYGIHFADERLKNMVLPIYLSSMDNKLLEIKNQWTDGQHSCDVAGLIGKSLYIKKQHNDDVFLLKELFNVFVQQCKDINKKYKNSKNDYLPMLPPRRFGWTYSTTSDLPWIESWLSQAEANE
jgi:hypothetical protein